MKGRGKRVWAARHLLLYLAVTSGTVYVASAIEDYQIAKRLAAMEPPSINLEIVVDPGFEGDLLVENDPAWTLVPDSTYELRQEGRSVRVPNGLFEASIRLHIIEIRDTEGTVLYNVFQQPEHRRITSPGFSRVETRRDTSSPFTVSARYISIQ